MNSPGGKSSDSSVGHVSRQQKLLKNVSSKYLDVAKYAAKGLLVADPGLKSIIYDPKPST